MMDFLNAIRAGYGSYKDSMFVVIPVGYEKTTSYVQGTRKGPERILSASKELEPFDPELNIHTSDYGVHTVKMIDTDAFDLMAKKVTYLVGKSISNGKIPVIIGGEHTISIPAIKTISSFLLSSNSASNSGTGMDMMDNGFTVLHLDAHLDMCDSFEGDKFSHFCVMKRVREIKGIKTVHMGIRTASEEELTYTNLDNVPVYWAPLNLENCIDNIISQLSDKVYVSIDLDVFDPSVMPALGTPEPGGLSWHDVVNVLREVAKRKVVLGFDVVELSPVEGLEFPNYTAAKLVNKFMNYIYSSTFRIEI